MTTTIIMDLQEELKSYLEQKNYRRFLSEIATIKIALFENNMELYDAYKIDLECLEYNVAFNDENGCIGSCNDLLETISQLA